MKFHKDLAKIILIRTGIVFLIAGVVETSRQVTVQRVIGGDTPESRTNKNALKDSDRTGQDIQTIISMGKEATNYVKGIVKKGDMVNIEFDAQKRDQYKRLLGYVYLNDGRMLNEEIIRAGYASPMTYPPNVKYRDRFLKACRDARGEKGRGLFRE